MVCGLSRVTLVTCNRVLTLRGKNARSQITFFVRLNLLTDLPSQVRSLKINANQTFPFNIRPQFNVKSHIGKLRRRLEYARLN